MKKIQNRIRNCIKYFRQFDYAPTAQEIYTYLRLKISKKSLTLELEKMTRSRILTKKASKMPNFPALASEIHKPFSHFQPFDHSNSPYRYTLPQYGKRITDYGLRITDSTRKIRRTDSYVRLISVFPQIKLIGLSGSVAMFNAGKKDDVDLFIITASNRMWTGRLIANMTAWLYGLKRPRGVRVAADKICLNLFFDSRGLKVPKIKQNEYVAREILQMKPLIVKNDIYKHFLEANKWIFKIFPNSRLRITDYGLNKQRGNQQSVMSNSIIGNVIEKILKRVQLMLINRHRTTEMITDRQLWFFPDDFEKKVRI